MGRYEVDAHHVLEETEVLMEDESSGRHSAIKARL